MNENDMFNLENNNGFNDKNNNNNFNMNNQGNNINYGSGQNYNQGNMQNTQYMNNNNYSNFNMNQNQTNGNLMNMNNMQNNMDIMNNNSMVSDDLIFNQMDEYKTHLRSLKEVQDLTSEVNVENPNSILQFGQRASEGISKVSDELLNSMKAVKTEEATEMLSSLTRIMDKFDVKELQNQDGKEGKISFFGKMFKKVQTSVADLFQKYDTMGIEVEKVYVILRKYEGEIRESNNRLKRLFDGNVEYYKLLEKYIVAGELAIEEIDNYINQYNLATNINEEEKTHDDATIRTI